MSINLVGNKKKALTGYPVRKLVAWFDSSTALLWIRGNGNYKQFVKNRTDKKKIAWRYENLVDKGSRCMSAAKMGELW